MRGARAEERRKGQWAAARRSTRPNSAVPRGRLSTRPAAPALGGEEHLRAPERGGGATRRFHHCASSPRRARPPAADRKRPPGIRAAHARRGAARRRVAEAAVGRDARGAVDDLRRQDLRDARGTLPAAGVDPLAVPRCAGGGPSSGRPRGPRRRARSNCGGPSANPTAAAPSHVRFSPTRTRCFGASDVLRPCSRSRPRISGGAV